MFSQFQVRYPTGSLISELLTIYNGKYVVRVAVAVDGITKATGMAVADTIELAEDQARSRALEIIGIRLSPTTDIPQMAEFSKPPVLSQEVLTSTNTGSISTDTSWLNETTQPTFPEKTNFTPSSVSSAATGASTTFTSNLDWKHDDYISNSEITSITNQTDLTAAFNKVTPIGSRRHDQEISAVAPDRVSTETTNSSPIDLSDAINRIPIEMSRLGWTTEQGRQYLMRTYGKRSRAQLDDEQVLEFLAYLQSQPSPLS